MCTFHFFFLGTIATLVQRVVGDLAILIPPPSVLHVNPPHGNSATAIITTSHDPPFLSQLFQKTQVDSSTGPVVFDGASEFVGGRISYYSLTVISLCAQRPFFFVSCHGIGVFVGRPSIATPTQLRHMRRRDSCHWRKSQQKVTASE
jgi:hypothetical protein